jgi:hypothetical protein
MPPRGERITSQLRLQCDNPTRILTGGGHGLAWYEFDLNRYGIYALGMLGLARDVKTRGISPDEDSDAAVQRQLAA